MFEPPIAQFNLPPDFIDLGLGDPDYSLLPLEALGQAARRYFSTGDRRPLQYGAEQGDGYFRRALATFLTRAYSAPTYGASAYAPAYGAHVHPDSLFVTTGASSALDLVCTLFTRPGNTILVEEPSYFLALRIFADHGLHAVPVPIDEGGLRLDALQEALIKFRPSLLYTIPTFQNPSGRTLPLERRQQLVALAQRYGFLLLADEVYQLLAYNQPPPPPLALAAAGSPQVISINSFSKILAPGLRLGWIQAHSSLIQRLARCGLLDSGGGLNPFTSALLRWFIESGDLERNIANLRQAYAARRDALEAALRQHLPAAEYALPEGGFFFWLRLPGVDAAELRRQAQRFNVGLRHGALFSSQNGLREYLRLGFCFYPPPALAEGVRRLAECYRASAHGTASEQR